MTVSPLYCPTCPVQARIAIPPTRGLSSGGSWRGQVYTRERHGRACIVYTSLYDPLTNQILLPCQLRNLTNHELWLYILDNQIDMQFSIVLNAHNIQGYTKNDVAALYFPRFFLQMCCVRVQLKWITILYTWAHPFTLSLHFPLKISFFFKLKFYIV